MEKGWCLEGRGMLSILALNWKRLRLGPVEGRKQEWVWQKRLSFLIRKKGSRTKGEGPSLTQPVGIPISSSCPAAPLAQPCRISWRMWAGPGLNAQMTGQGPPGPQAQA